MLAMLARAFTRTVGIILIATAGVIVSPFWDTVLERFDQHALQSALVVLAALTAIAFCGANTALLGVVTGGLIQSARASSTPAEETRWSIIIATTATTTLAAATIVAIRALIVLLCAPQVGLLPFTES